MLLMAIDPGLSNTGLVVMAGTGSKTRKSPVNGSMEPSASSQMSSASSETTAFVISASTVRHAPAKRDLEALYIHCSEITAEVLKVAGEHHPNIVVMEDFVGYRGCDYIYLSQTPKLCAWLYSALTREGYEVVLQTSEIFRRNRKGNVAWVRDKVKEGVEVVPGALQCTNEHERSALAHAIYYLEGIGNEG